MTRSISSVLSPEDLAFLWTLPEVAAARENLNNGAAGAANGMVYFDIPLTDSIKSTLRSRLGLDLSAVERVPMRWIKGDLAPHVDAGISTFLNTYLLYLNDNPGELVVGDETYPIEKNTAYVFNEGVEHKTVNTGGTPRLLLGPMSDAGFAVGSPMFYYPTLTDALNYTNQLGYSSSYTVGDAVIGDLMGYTSWRIASNSTGASSQALVYANGTPLNPGGTYFMYPSAPCFLEGSRILCEVDGKEAYVPIEQLRKGSLVKTSRDGLKRVEMIGSGTIQNSGGDERTETRLYRCSKDVYPELNEDLILTGCHSILVSSLTEEQREKTIKQLGQIYVTDKKYRLMACIDDRAVPWQKEGIYSIWHFALESDDDGINYGVYANGGLLVETCSLRFMKHKSNMKMVE